MGVHWTKSSAGIQARTVVCPSSKIPGFLSGSCHHEFDRHKSNRIQANGIFIIPGLLVFGPSLSGLVGLRAFPFRACWSSGLPFPGLLVFGPSLSGLVGLRAFPFRACWSSGLPFPGLLVFGPSLSGLVGLRAFPFRACWSSGLPFPGLSPWVRSS